MHLSIRAIEDYWASLEGRGQTHKRVSEREAGRRRRNTETSNSNYTGKENEILRPCHETSRQA